MSDRKEKIWKNNSNGYTASINNMIQIDIFRNSLSEEKYSYLISTLNMQYDSIRHNDTCNSLDEAKKKAVKKVSEIIDGAKGDLTNLYLDTFGTD